MCFADPAQSLTPAVEMIYGTSTYGIFCGIFVCLFRFFRPPYIMYVVYI